MAADTSFTKSIVVIGTSESGPRKFRIVDRHMVLRPDSPAPEAGFPPSKPGPVRVDQNKSDADKGNHWVSRVGVDIIP